MKTKKKIELGLNIALGTSFSSFAMYASIDVTVWLFPVLILLGTLYYTIALQIIYSAKKENEK